MLFVSSSFISTNKQTKSQKIIKKKSLKFSFECLIIYKSTSDESAWKKYVKSHLVKNIRKAYTNFYGWKWQNKCKRTSNIKDIKL